ncbi:peptidoglycan recognition protein family protein [Amycolatopsis sp. NPDC003731]
MAYLTNLADFARSAGLRVVEQPGWKTRGHGSFGAVLSVVCHHTGTPTTSGNYPSLNVVTNGRADLAGPLCNFGLGRDGTVYVVAAGVAWHAGATVNDAVYGNNHSIGIEAEGTGKDAWPEAQLDAYARLCTALTKAFSFPVSRVQGHKEICYPHGRKPDPNFDMNAFRGRVSAVLAGNPVHNPTPKERKMITPQSLPYSADWSYEMFPVESSGNSGIMSAVWFRIATGWGGSCEYEVNFVNRAGEAVAAPGGDCNFGPNAGKTPKQHDTMPNNGFAYWSLPADCTSIGFRYRNLTKENRLGLSFPQKEKAA